VVQPSVLTKRGAEGGTPPVNRAGCRIVGVTTVQLRRYVMEPGRLDALVAWFPTLIPAREKFGFRVLFALADREREIFTWAVALDGDEARFREVEAAYNESPERAAAFETYPDGIAEREIGPAEDVLAALAAGR
jgi:hypothetical protein